LFVAAALAQEGDVLLSNHPQLAGGSHLPDITVITPVFSGGRIVFFVASRGHHADIGGITPGSMPPASKTLMEEGAAIVSFKLVSDGAFQVSEGVWGWQGMARCSRLWALCLCVASPALFVRLSRWTTAHRAGGWHHGAADGTGQAGERAAGLQRHAQPQRQPE
jgi:hypothetical protein